MFGYLDWTYVSTLYFFIFYFIYFWSDFFSLFDSYYCALFFHSRSPDYDSVCTILWYNLPVSQCKQRTIQPIRGVLLFSIYRFADSKKQVLENNNKQYIEKNNRDRLISVF